MKQRIALVEFQFAGLRLEDGRSGRQDFRPRCLLVEFFIRDFLRHLFPPLRLSTLPNGSGISMAGNTVSPFIVLPRIKSECPGKDQTINELHRDLKIILLVLSWHF